VHLQREKASRVPFAQFMTPSRADKITMQTIRRTTSYYYAVRHMVGVVGLSAQLVSQIEQNHPTVDFRHDGVSGFNRIPVIRYLPLRVTPIFTSKTTR
jgi:hypothetical protein